LMGFLGFGTSGGSGGGGTSALKDMFDGGGRGGSGGSFSMMRNNEYKAAGGAQAVPGQRPQGFTSMGDNGKLQRRGFGGYGYEDPTTKQWVNAGTDAFNGGGAGTAGSSFKGAGLYSGLLNMFGVNPMGYDPNAPVQPQAAEQGQGQPSDNSALVNMINNNEYLIKNSTNGQSDNGYQQQQQQPPGNPFQIPSGAYTQPSQITQTALGPNNMPMPEYLRSLSGRVNNAVAPPNRGRYGSM
jgi:hypothetical protein